MAHGLNAKKYSINYTREWWSKRPYRYYHISHRAGVNKQFKRFCHKVERNQGKIEIRKQLEEN